VCVALFYVTAAEIMPRAGSKSVHGSLITIFKLKKKLSQRNWGATSDIAQSSRAMDQGDGYTRVAALCISNFKYRHEGGIANAEKDAKAFEKKLKELPGCTVKLCENFQQPQHFTDKIRDFLQDEGA